MAISRGERVSGCLPEVRNFSSVPLLYGSNRTLQASATGLAPSTAAYVALGRSVAGVASGAGVGSGAVGAEALSA
jgi:hypothetical protein